MALRRVPAPALFQVTPARFFATAAKGVRFYLTGWLAVGQSVMVIRFAGQRLLVVRDGKSCFVATCY